MQNRINRLFSLLVVLFAFSGVSTVRAQVRIPADAITSTAELKAVFQTGSQLERDRRWGEALTHYEEALRDHPGRSDLQQRLMIARVHYDLVRRYNDRSFLRAFSSRTDRETLDELSEVLLKIHTHYVDTPNWQAIQRRGTNNLDIALTEPLFLKTHLPNQNAADVAAFRRYLSQTINARIAHTRHDVRETAWVAGQLVNRHLGIPARVAIMEYACGAISSLDPYSTFLTTDQLNEAFSQIEGNFVGLGIELRAEGNALLIVSVIAGSPAADGGLQEGDKIVEVDGHATDDVSTDRAAEMLKGPENSVVEVTVQDVQSGNFRRVQLKRRRIEVPSVDNISIVDKQMGVAYMRLSTFQQNTVADVDKALWKLREQGMRSLIVDVRGNPGGLLKAAVQLADKFVDRGRIVSTRGRSPREDFDYKAQSFGTWRVPLTVLIDHDSASASEIFAGAIRDNRRGTVVGERSYGKGSVQGIFPLNASSAGVRLTTAKFYSPNGHPISNRGVHPDVQVRTTARPDETGNAPEAAGDPIMAAALDVARNQLTRRN